MRSSRSVLLLALLLSVFACGNKKEATPAPAPAPPPAAPAQTGKGPHKRATLGPDDPMTMMGRLTFEAQHRPTGVLKTEDVMAALKEAGIEISAPEQRLALQARASYCVQGATKRGNGVSVCEYADEAAAIAGREYSLAALAVAKNRLLTVRKGTLLTVTTTVEPPESDVEAKKIVGVFEKL